MKRCLYLLALVLLLGPTVSAANDYPAKPVRIVLPYAAGGGGDILTRIVAQKLSERWGQPVVVDNRPGAGATIGTEVVAKAQPDGYTLLVTAGTIALSPSAYPNLPYDVLKDFTPISTLARSPFVLVVHPSVPARSLQALLKQARGAPGKLNFGSAGNGTMAHLSIELLKMQAGIDVTHVPYKGSNPAFNDLLGGRVDAVFDTPAAVMPYMATQKVYALAVTTATRSSSAPDVPTIAEAGIADYDVSVWFGLLAPAGTPKPIVTRIQEDTAKVLAMPDVVQQLGGQGLEVIATTPDAFAAYLRSEVQKWGDVVKRGGIKFQ